MGIICPECKKDISSQQITKGFIKCPHCNFLYNFQKEKEHAEKTSYTTNKSLVGKPDNLNSYIENDKLIIERFLIYEYSNIFWSLVAGIIFIAFAYNLKTSQFQNPSSVEKIMDISIRIFQPILFISGFYNFYYGLTSIFNKMIIITDKQNITIKYSPFPAKDFSTPSNIPLKNLIQLYCKANYIKGRIADYEVYAKYNNKNDKIIVRQLKNYQNARYIEQEIEKFLQIKDVSINREDTC